MAITRVKIGVKTTKDDITFEESEARKGQMAFKRYVKGHKSRKVGHWPPKKPKKTV